MEVIDFTFHTRDSLGSLPLFRFLIFAIAFALCPNSSSGDDAIAPETIELVKKATVFVRVEGDGWSGTGSGFVIAADDKSILIATNRHVAMPTLPSDVRSNGKPGTITVVFDSGTKTERSFTSTIVAVDSERDLAVLRVAALKDAPRPIAYAEQVKLVETMPVYTFGFPFGKALSSNKGSPAVTVGKASISSLRNGTDGELAVVQIDGNLNPGNSGGPVVDVKGRLVGIAVATIRDGQGIGLTIPAADLDRMMQGRLGRVRITPKKAMDGSAMVRVEVDLIDPAEKLRAVTAHYVVLEPKSKRPDGEIVQKMSGSKKIELKIEKGVGSGEFTLPKADGEILVQVMADPVGKAAITSKVRTLSLATSLKPGDFTGTPPSGWMEYSPKDKTFVVWVPEKPEKQSEQERTLLVRAQRMKMTTMVGKSASGLLYEAQSIVLPTSFIKAPRKDIYDMFKNAVVDAVKGRVTESKEIEMGSLSGAEYYIEADSTHVRLRISVTGQRVYLAQVIGDADQVVGTEAETILASYRLPTAAVASKGPSEVTTATPSLKPKDPTVIGGVNAPPFKDLAPEKGVLIGLELGLGKFGPEDVIKAVRPIYRVGDKEQLGTQYGTLLNRVITIKAKEGYGVGAITYKFGLNFDGCSLTFMKLADDKLDPKESYESEWVGYVGKKPSNKISGEGSPTIGIAGRGTEKEVNGLGLIFGGQEVSLTTATKVKDAAVLGGAFDPEFKDLAPEGGLLVGFEIGLIKFGTRDMIKAARPIYRVGEKETFGEQHGTQVKNLVTLKAKSGYAVGGISVKYGLCFDGMSVTFMKVVDGKLDPKENYESEYVGTDEDKQFTKVGGTGTPVVGIIGKFNRRDMTGMNLLFKGQEGYEPKKRP